MQLPIDSLSGNHPSSLQGSRINFEVFLLFSINSSVSTLKSQPRDVQASMSATIRGE